MSVGERGEERERERAGERKRMTFSQEKSRRGKSGGHLKLAGQ